MKPKTLYMVDNGAILCRDHLGYTAKATGRDISGQPILKLTDADIAAMQIEIGMSVRCETCRWTNQSYLLRANQGASRG